MIQFYSFCSRTDVSTRRFWDEQCQNHLIQSLPAIISILIERAGKPSHPVAGQKDHRPRLVPIERPRATQKADVFTLSSST